MPWPLDTGGHIRSYHLLAALARSGCEVTLMTPVADAAARAHDRLLAAGIAVQPIAVGPRTWPTEAVKAAGALLAREPYVFYRRHRWRRVQAALDRAMAAGGVDVLYLDHLDSAAYVTRPGTVTTLDMHNVYSTLLSRSADDAGALLKRRALRVEAGRLRRVEARAVSAADLTFAVSDDDAAVFAGLGARRVVIVPNGVDTAPLAALPAGRGPTPAPVLLFVGALSWAPNEAACRCLVREVLPAVRARVPLAEAHLVGRSPSEAIRSLADQPGVKLFADVPDVAPHLAAASVLVVPLTVGGGTRLKILEAFAAGLPVVSTAVGAEGIAGEHGRHLLIAEPGEMASAVTRLLDDPALATELAAEARRLARSTYDWAIVGRTAAEALAVVVRQRASHA